MVDGVSGQLFITPIRIIPFDLGAEIDAGCRAKIEAYVGRHQHLRPSAQREKERALVGEASIQFYVDATPSRRLTFDVFLDGHALITLRDDFAVGAKGAFDPRGFLLDRRRIHRQLLRFEHSVSPLIRTHVDGLRAVVRDHKKGRGIRRSANADWGHRGLAYVFSAHFVEYDDDNGGEQAGSATAALVRDDAEFREKIALILEPSYMGLEDTPVLQFDERADAEARADVPPAVANGMDHQLTNIETRKGYLAYASWANLVVLGQVSEEIIEDYVFLEKRLQHVWAMCFCLCDTMNSYLEVDVGIELGKLGSLRAKTEMQIQHFRQIADPSLGARHLKIMAALVATSRIEDQIKLAEANIRLVYDRVQFLASSEQRKSQHHIELLLVVLTLIQGTYALLSLFDISSPEKRPFASTTLAVLLLVVILLLIGWLSLPTHLWKRVRCWRPLRRDRG